MEFHRHRFDNIEDYLHHRPPYLMVDRAVEIHDTKILTEKTFTGEEHFASGHFPGAMIFPGAMMQEVTTQSAGILIAANYNPMSEYNTHDPKFNPWALGVLLAVSNAKFKSFAKPNDVLQATVELEANTATAFDFVADVKVAGKLIMQNKFRLANVQSELLM